MKNLKKFENQLSIVPILLIAVVAAFGVSCQKQDAKGAGSAASKTVDYTNHETFTVMGRSIANIDFYADYSENPIVRYLGNKHNIELKFQTPAVGTDANAMALMLATGEYPDLIDMSAYTGSASSLFSDGVIVDISQYLDYMPNYKKILDSDINFRRMAYNDDGQILALRVIHTEVEFMWGGLVYRHDILETMTGGNIKFPSGGDTPITIEDWDYMLPLFKAYFEASGMKEYAPLIIPFNGTFYGGEIVSGFGAAFGTYVEGDRVRFGPFEDGFYYYLQKIHEWYEKGYIYKDFVSRVNDMFFLPNPALTYGGAAGVWFGLQSQLGSNLSMPEYGLNVDVRAIPSPLDTGHGITEAPTLLLPSYYDDGVAWTVSSVCKNIPKILSVLDFMYTDEGGMLKVNGLTREQGAADDPVYKKAGLVDGAYWFENGEFVFNPLLAYAGGELDSESFTDVRMPGKSDRTVYRDAVNETIKEGDKQWAKYSDTKRVKLPSSLSYPDEDEKIYTSRNVQINDYITNIVPKFIMGTESLDDASWTAFKARLKALGVDDLIRIQQAAYDRYLKR
jgi:ABC-type glycerol-3-phosphate transport system substrate-binding protein